ncbi:MAG: hypothetical protein KF852_16765 [Saprospiraceae bacterium]|nr:hypothetical protein [Saprospiraceae bacterium]
MRPRYLYGFLCCCYLLTAGSCTDDAPSRLSSSQMEMLDSLVAAQMPVMRVEQDSLCAIDFGLRLRHLVDSLLIERRAEEARLRQRIPKQ